MENLLSEQVRLSEQKTEVNIGMGYSHFNNILDRITDVFIALDNDWNFIYLNKRACEIFSLVRDQVIGKSIWSELPVEITAIFKNVYHDAMAGQKQLFLEVYFPSMDKWFENNIYPSGDGLSLYFRCITERKKMEEVFMNSEARFRKVVEHISDALIVDDIEGNVVYANDKFFRLFGLRKEDLGQIKIEDYAAPRSHAELRERHEKRIRGENVPSHFEYEGFRSDGKPLWLEVDVTLVHDERGRTSGTQSTIRDITARKKAEQDLLNSTSLLQATLESTNDGILVVDLKGKITGYNRQFVKMWNVPEDVLQMMDDERAMRDGMELLKDASSFVEKVKWLYSNPSEVSFDSFELKDGRTFERYSQPQKIKDEIVGRVWSFRDVSHARKAESDLRESETRYRNVVENIHEVLTIDDLNGNLVYANSEFCKIFGYTQEEALNLTLKDYVSPDSYAEVIDRHKRRILGLDVEHEYEYKGIRKDGTEMFMEARVSVLTMNNKIVGTQSLDRDITHRKIAEDEIRTSEEKFRSVIKNTADGFVLYDFETQKVIETNSAYDNMLGYTSDEMKKLSVHDIVAHEKSEIDRNWEQIRLQKFLKIGKRDHHRKDGSTLPVEVTANFLDVGSRKVVSILVRDISERLEKEKIIKKREEDYRSLIENASDGIFISNLDEQFVDVNTSACLLTGYSKEELLTMSVMDLVVILEGETPSRIDEIKRGIRVVQIRNMRRKDGTMLPIEVTANMLPDNRVLSIVRDISDRIIAEQEISKSQKQFQSLVENISGVYWVNDLDNYKTIYVSPSYETIWGRKCDDLYANPASFIDAVHPDDKKALIEKHKTIGSTRRANLTFRIIRPDGEVRWVIVKVNVAIDKCGRKIEYGYADDITEMKKAEESLSASENYLRTIFQAEPECVKLIDRKFLLEDMNPAGLAMIEADNLEQVKGKSILNIIDEPFRNSFIELNKRVFAGQSGKLEFTITGLKGTNRWMETHTVPISGTDGVVSSSLGITRDITERKKAEKEIILMNQQLRNLSTHLQNIREEERAYIAREIHDELGQQLTLIKMNLHSLIRRDRSKNPEFVEAVTAIGESVSQTIDAVRRIASEMRPFALNDFSLEEAMQLHTNEFSRKTKIPATLNIEGNIGLTEISKCTQVFRIYQEALTNIARHADATKIVSILKFKNGILQMRINDNGKGFNLLKVSEIKSLGLIMMRERAIGIGGNLEIISEPGMGTSVVFSLPFNDN